MKKIDYASLYTLRADGRYMGYDTSSGKRRAVYDRDPERLWHKLNDPKPPVVVTFRQAADRWAREHYEEVSFKTAESYVAPLRRLTEQFGDEDITTITAAQLKAYLKLLGPRGYARRTVQLHRDILNMIFNFAVSDKNNPLTVNPCDSVSVPKGLRKTPGTMPDDEAIEAVISKPDVPFALFALVCLYTGMRRGEVLALRYEDIDRKNRLINVSRSVEYRGNRPYIKAPKTDAGTRRIPLLDPLADVLPANGTGYLFTDNNGNLLSKSVYRTRWLQYCAAVGYTMTSKQFRHGYATFLYEAKIGDKDVQEIFGHSSIVTTRNNYTHIRPVHRAQTARQLNDYFSHEDAPDDPQN